MGNHGDAPTFTYGQVLSTAEHMDPLEAYVQGLADGLRGPTLPFGGLETQMLDPETRLTYRGYIIHEYDTFAYSYYILDNGSAEIQINDQTVPGSAHTGTGTYSAADVDISSLGLTKEQVYPVSFVGDADYRVWLLAETYAPTFPILPASTDESTPTSAEWQSFSDYADLLDEQLSQPRALVSTCHNRNPQVSGTFNHRCRYLAYKIRVVSPYWYDNNVMGEEWQPGGHRSTSVYLRINDVVALKLYLGHDNTAINPIGYAEDTYWYRKVYSVTAGDEYIFTGLLDLTAYPVGALPIFGQDYPFLIEQVTQTIPEDTTSTSNLITLHEVDLAAGLPIPDWEPFTGWQHGYFVQGDTGQPQVHTLKNNLEALSAVIQTCNYPCALKMVPFVAPGEGLYSVRRWRWLRFISSLWWRDADGDGNVDTLFSLPGQINYMYRGEYKTVDLNGDSGAVGEWQVFDLESVPGLFAGTDYSLHDVDYAFEVAEWSIDG